VKYRYIVVIEKGDTSYGAYVPDLPGCVAVGDTAEEVERLIQEAIEFHIEGLQLDGDPVPEPATRAATVEVEVSASAGDSGP
jgi:predicted RNase H-like HicB family nuclease